MYPHVIRLRKPWDIDSPATSARPIVCCSRRFNRPSGLVTGEFVWLVFHGPQISFTAWLNDRPLPLVAGDSAALQANVTAQLAASNLLRLEFSQSDPRDPASGAAVDRRQTPRELPAHWLEQVSLEIRLAETD